ncbi:lysM domain-containing protein [Artemisia annua]|uniref:LysM domain-containing protein n=1 Tax=Artemisia annua TaxID=35608 RepID=A0A2U1LU52_ARTAN|nr:lysM domain-containing protein [Artemisia annua]
MARINNKTVICMLLVFVFVGIMTITEGRSTFLGVTPFCVKVIGVKSGDTCFDIAQKFKMSTRSFHGVNPNLNCKKLFVGEWICVSGVY